MSLHVKRTITLLKQNIWIIGILLGMLSWVFDGVIDFMFFSRESLVKTIFIPESNEIWMRTFNFFILVAFGFFVHLAWNRQKKIQQDLKCSQEQGKQLLRQFRAILDGTGQDTGKNFFSSMVKQLAATLNVRDAFIGTLVDGETKMKSLAFISGENFLDTITYELAGTPCEKVLNEAQCIYNGNVQANFPKDDYLKENNINSYLGYPLTDMNGLPIGIMSVMDSNLFDNNAIENIQAILRAFAARVEAELRRIQIERKMKHYAEKLEQSNQDLQDFAYIASHDLKEPIRKIIIFGEMFERKVLPLDAEQKGLLMRMIKGANRMNALIDDLLQLSRIKTQSTAMVKSDLNQIVTATLEEFDFQILELKARIHVEDLPALKVDRVHMRQLFENLISNALKYRNPEQPPEITIRGQKNEHNIWQISVADNGIGFDEKYIDRIFKPFERLHGKETYDGTGMGLAICKKIVERHGGTIAVKSSHGNGATFSFTLHEG